MNRLHQSLSIGLVSLSTTLALLTGCAGFSGASFPDASVNPEHASLGTISGSNFGGHAPLVGAHVYVLQPSAAVAGSNGYGLRANSILDSTGTANGATYPNPVLNTTDPDIPTTWYYQTTDSTGAFNISGDYTCVVGLPVYLYLYGGSPTFPSGSNVFNVTNISSVNSTGEVTFTVSTVENAYIGEQVSFAGLSSVNGFSALNGATRSIDAVNLTTSTFSINVGAGNTANYSSGGDGGGTATLIPTFNPGVVNLATLGNCPSGGFTGSNSISYVYVNEVSTVATAYAFRPFTQTPTSTTTGNNATYISTSTGNIAGIQNAAILAKQLYDITGSQITTSYAGEGHIANTLTVHGNGVVPQANIDTIGNILAACVDSNNTATTIGTAGISAQCSTLFTNVTSNGIPTTASTGAGVQPLDIAQAALNLARHPGGPPYSYSPTGASTFMSTLFSLPTGNVPFTPNLTTQPNDFTIAIAYTAALNPATTGSYTTAVEGLAIDKIGNVWLTTPNSESTPYYFYQMTPSGVIGNVQTGSYHFGMPVIDSGESAWAGSETVTGAETVTYVHATSTPAAAAGSAPPTYTYATGGTNSTLNEYYTYPSVADANGNVYFGNGQTTSSTNTYLETFSGAATTPTVTGTESAALTGAVSATSQAFISGAINVYQSGSGTQSAFFDIAGLFNGGRVTITAINLANNSTDTGFPVYGENDSSATGATAGCTTLLDAEKLTVTRSGDVIVPDFHNAAGSLNAATDSLYYITHNTGTPGTCAQLSAATLQVGLYAPWATATDGNDYVYVLNRLGNNISVINTQSNTAAGTVGVSPNTGYSPQYLVSGTLTKMLSQPFGLAIGPSGEMWIGSPGTNTLVEVIGLASPTATPTSVASSSTNNLLGYRP